MRHQKAFPCYALDRGLTLAIPITTVKIIGAIQGTNFGPRVVHAKPNRPIGRQGMTDHHTFL